MFVTMVGVAVVTVVLGRLIGVVTIDLADRSEFRGDDPTLASEKPDASSG